MPRKRPAHESPLFRANEARRKNGAAPLTPVKNPTTMASGTRSERKPVSAKTMAKRSGTAMKGVLDATRAMAMGTTTPSRSQERIFDQMHPEARRK